MKVWTMAAFAFALAVLSVPRAADAQAPAPKSDPGAGNSVQCWDTQAAVVRDKGAARAMPKNDTSAVAGASPAPVAPSTSTPVRDATPRERAVAKRPPGIEDC